MADCAKESIFKLRIEGPHGDKAEQELSLAQKRDSRNKDSQNWLFVLRRLFVVLKDECNKIAECYFQKTMNFNKNKHTDLRNINGFETWRSTF